MTIPLTEPERDAVGVLRSTGAPALAAAVTGVLDQLAAAHPSRTERLAILGELARQTREARDALLDEVIDASGPAWSVYFLHALAELAGVSRRTVDRRLDGLVRRTPPIAQEG